MKQLDGLLVNLEKNLHLARQNCDEHKVWSFVSSWGQLTGKGGPFTLWSSRHLALPCPTHQGDGCQLGSREQLFSLLSDLGENNLQQIKEEGIYGVKGVGEGCH